MPLIKPTPDQVRAARAAAALTMAEAGTVVHRPDYRRWSEWERGVVAMPLAEWELFVMKTFPRREWGHWLN